MPFLAGFGKRKALKYGTSFPGSNLSGFPKLFEIAGDSNIASELASGGGIAVTGSDGTTEVPFEIQTGSAPASGNLILFVKFDLLTAASTGDVIGYLYYDAGETNHDDPTAVWDSDFVLVWHLEEDPSGSAPQILDSTANNNDGTSAGSMVGGDLVSALVHNGLSFDGSDDRINSPTFAAVTNQVCITCVLIAPGTADSSAPLTMNGLPLLFSRLGADIQVQTWTGPSSNFNGTLATGCCDSTPHVVSVRYDNANVRTYTDGTQTDIDTATGDINFVGTLPTMVTLAAFSTGGNPFSGVIDEFRLSRSARSAAWVGYESADLLHNSDTFSLGSQETAGGGTFTGTGTLASSSATLSGSATFTNPVYSGTAALTSSATTLAGSAMFAAAIYSGNGALTSVAATLSGSATFVAPTYSGSGALASTAAVLAGSATFTPPTYTGSGVLTSLSATLSGVAIFATEAFVGTGALTSVAATLAGSATFTVPAYTGAGTLAASAAVLVGSAVFASNVFIGTGTLTSIAAVLAGTAATLPPVVTCNGALVTLPARLAGLARTGDENFASTAYYLRFVAQLGY